MVSFINTYLIFLQKKFNPNTKRLSPVNKAFLLSRNSLANFSNFVLGLGPVKTIHLLLEIVKKIIFLFSMAKLASMRESLNREEKELYEKYRKGGNDVTSENPVKEIRGSQYSGGNVDDSEAVYENESQPGNLTLCKFKFVASCSGPFSH